MGALIVNADGSAPFTGCFRHKLEQSRVTLPGRWRQATTTKTFVIVIWPLGVDQHLLALPPRRWEKIVVGLRDQPLTNEQLAATERILATSVAWAELDNVGRLTLPDRHFASVGIEQEVELIGRLDKFELWNPARYQQVMLEDRKVAAGILKQLNV
jgi:MraZ protein